MQGSKLDVSTFLISLSPITHQTYETNTVILLNSNPSDSVKPELSQLSSARRSLWFPPNVVKKVLLN